MNERNKINVKECKGVDEWDEKERKHEEEGSDDKREGMRWRLAEKKEVKLNDEVMVSETPDSIFYDESIDRILSCPSSLTKKYPSHLHKPKNKLTDVVSDRPFASLTQIKSGGSLINPNMVQLFYCLSSIIQAQIADDCDRYDEGAEQEDPGYLLYPIFDIPLPSLPPHCGGNIQPYEVIGDGLETMLSHEITDEELKNKIETQRVPPLMSIFRYIVYLYSAAEYSPECNIMALVYINRLTAMNQVILTQFNWRSIWLVVIMLAQKVWDDRPLRTSDFVRLLPDIDSKILRELEYQTLTMLKYITGVKPSLYAKYYFELRTLYSDIMGSNPSCGEWALEPLSNYLASKLDMKNQKLEENRLKMMQQHHPRASAASSSSSSSTPAIAGAKESGGAAGGGEFDQFKFNDKKSSSASTTPPSSSHSLSRHRDHDTK